jgi:cytochrome c oxidase subunit 1
MGGTVMGFLAGLHYWFPKMTGRMLSEKLARAGWLLTFIGFNVTFLTQFFLGYHGMPRRWAEYPPQFQGLNIVSTAGSWILALGILLMFINFIRGLYAGEPAPANPWKGLTLEWRTPSPPPTENFEEIPVVADWPYGYTKRQEEAGRK